MNKRLSTLPSTIGNVDLDIADKIMQETIEKYNLKDDAINKIIDDSNTVL